MAKKDYIELQIFVGDDFSRPVGIVHIHRDGDAHARKMTDFRRRAERISRSLEGRAHTDSAKLLREVGDSHERSHDPQPS
jgi:hypothetical protein